MSDEIKRVSLRIDAASLFSDYRHLGVSVSHGNAKKFEAWLAGHARVVVLVIATNQALHFLPGFKNSER